MTSKNSQEKKESNQTEEKKSGRKRKCLVCGEYITEEEGVLYKGRYAHSKCFAIVVKTLHTNKQEQLKSKEKEKTTSKAKPRPKAELKNALSEEEYADKVAYYDYLKGLLGVDELSAKIYVLTENHIKHYNFTYKSMLQTLVYLKEIIERDLVGDVVGLIPYYHTQAENFYQSVNKIKEQNEGKSIQRMYETKVVKIKPRPRKIKQIDIESIT